MLFPSNYYRQFLDMESLCRNWITTPEGTERAMGNRAQALRNLAIALNRCLGRMPRPMAWMAIPLEFADTTGSDPLYRWRYQDSVNNGRSFAARIIGVPRTSGSGDCYAGHEGGSGAELSQTHNQTVTTVDMCEDAYYTQYRVERGDPALTRVTRGLSTFNGMTVLDVILQDVELGQLDTSIHDYVNPALASGGQPVLADLLEQIRAAFHRLRRFNLSLAFSWSAQCQAGSWDTPATSGQTGIVVTSSSYVNALDQTVTSRSASSPGLVVPALYAGMGPIAESWGRPRVFVTVHGEATSAGNDGTVKFEGPLDNTEITVTGGSATGWWGTTNYITLDPSKDDDDATSGRNKVDILAKVAAGTLYIRGIDGWIELP